MSPAADAVTIPRAYNGPLESGNGGYSCGAFAGLLDGPATVTLRSPVPLDTPLTVDRALDDGAVAVWEGDTLIAEAKPSPALALTAPEPVGIEAAHAASEGYVGAEHGPFSHCFVCGRGRNDAVGVVAGPVEGRDLVASPWTPREEDAGSDGAVRDELTWAVLDCPTYFALYPAPNRLSFLGRMSARVDRAPRAGEEHVVIAWPIERDGRKHHAGSAVLSANGETLAIASVLMIDTTPA